MLQIGIIKTSFKINDLAFATTKTSNQEKDNIRSIKREFNVKAISTEINVIRSKC